jgi:uncharacterized membrane protein
MDSASVLPRLTDQPALDVVAEGLGRAVRGAYAAAGPIGRRAKNAMHGTWLGHPLHAALEGLPIGAWTTALVLDVVAARNPDDGINRAADIAIAVGLVGALSASIAGLTDWSETSGRPRRSGLVHGLLNITATALYATAYVFRRKGDRTSGRRCALAGYSLAVAGGYTGGELVFEQGVGVQARELHPA